MADRFNQVRDNWGFLVEEHTSSKRQGLYRRLYADISDLLRVDPDHREARAYWADISYGNQGDLPFRQPEPPPGVPLWAFRQVEELKLARRFVNWWIDQRQVAFGDFGGGISDDSDMVQQWPGLALMGVDPDKLNASLTALADAAHRHGMFTDGLATLVTDELHAYEEGINSDSAALYLNWGNPKVVERMMATVDALHRVVLPNPAGHLHFASNWYGGNKIYREGPWEWGKPYSYTVIHPAVLLGGFNADPRSRAMVIGLCDGYLAHARQAPDGTWVLPNEVNWRTDAERGGEIHQGSGATVPLQLFWAAYRWTGDEKYLRPLLNRVAKAGERSINEMGENLLDVLGRRGDWGKALLDKAAGAKGGFELYAAWQVTGDKAWLERLAAEGIRDKSQNLYMNTEGHWWSDRVESPSDLLQRQRLGGVALRRNWQYPGHTVSWRFAEPDGAEQVAILVPGATRDRFTVIAHNLSDRPQAATMTTWNVTAGQWRMVAGVDRDGDDRPDGETASQAVPLERSASLPLTLAPGQTTVLAFTLEQPTTPTEQRPDLGIGPDDVRPGRGGLSVTVHSLGAADAAGGTVLLEDGDGKVLASAPVPALAAPRDLKPRTAEVTLPLPAGVKPAGLTVRVALPGDAAEVTMANNRVRLP